MANQHHYSWVGGALRALAFRRTELAAWSPSLWLLAGLVGLSLLSGLAIGMWLDGFPGHLNVSALPIELFPLLWLVWLGYLLDNAQQKGWARRLPVMWYALSVMLIPLWVAAAFGLRADWWDVTPERQTWRMAGWWGLFALNMLWPGLAVARQLRPLRDLSLLRGLGLGLLLAVLSGGFTVAYNNVRLWVADGPSINMDSAASAPSVPAPLPETALFFRQQELLGKQLDALLPERPGVTDLYLVSVAGFGGQSVFLREAQAVRQLFDWRYGTAGRSVLLANATTSADRLPMASRDTLEAAIQATAKRMNRDEDVLVLFVTSHGSANHEVSLSYPNLELQPLTPTWLKQTLQRAGIRWKLVAVSACYAGGFVAPLGNPETAIVTAADATHTSFGCSDTEQYTYFGRALFVEALAREADLRRAFSQAKAAIAKREQDGGYTHSNPQLFIGEAFARKLPRLPVNTKH